MTWDLARSMAERHALEMELITNAQFLDEAKFHELEPYVSSLTFSIDSHIREIYERIRLRSRPDKVFANLPPAVQLCREHGIEPNANVVFMVENAAFIDETVAYLADIGCTTVRLLALITLPGVTPDRVYSNPLDHMSPQWVDRMLQRVETVARDKRIQVLFEGRERIVYDYQPKDLQFRANRQAEHAAWEEIRYFFPGYCVQSVDHLKVHSDGDAYPCCVAAGDTLKLGNLETQTFDEVWNGKEAQDLRRGMLTQDLPEICKTCSFHTAWILPEQPHMPVVDWFFSEADPGRSPIPEERRTLEVTGPEHLTRQTDAPTFTWRAPDTPVNRYALVMGVGGIYHPDNRIFWCDGDATEFTIPDDDWAAIQSNLGMWWFLLGLDDDAPERSVRTATLRCIVRHQPIPRVPGSRLYDHG